MRRLASAIALAAALALGQACAPPPSTLPATVEYSGCRAVLEPAGVCILRSKRELRLWVESPRENRIELRVDGRKIDSEGEPVQGGQRFTLTVPAGARKVDVRVPTERGTAAWSLVLAEASPEAPIPSGQRDVVADIDKQTAQVYRQLRARDLTAARATLSALSLPPRAPGESRYLFAYYRGLLAEREGDFRAALAEIQQAIEIAERVKPERYLWLAEEELALLLRGIGRSRDAALLFARLRQTPYAGNACEEAQLLNNLAWSTLLAREAGERSVHEHDSAQELGDPAPILEEALAKYASCSAADPEQKVNVLLNLALARLQEGGFAAAQALLEQARALEEHPPLPHTLWSIDLEGRIALGEGRPRAALERFAALDELSTETSSFDGRLRAAFGLAQSRQALGDSVSALAGLDAAESLLDEQSLQIPIDAGRETFLAARRSLVSLHVALLLDSGRNGDALAATRRARSRVVRQLANVDALAGLSPEERSRRTHLLTDYQQRRAALEERARNDWKLPADELRHERAARKLEAVEVKALLDAAYTITGAAARGAMDLPAPRPGELMLVYQPLAGDTWVAFAADGRGVEARRFVLPAGSLPAPEALSERLLLPFRTLIARAEKLRVLASGRLAEVDVHALPFAGQPLLAGRPVVYGLDLPADLASRSPERMPGGRALLISDARGDLPGSRQEAGTVRATLGAQPPAWAIAELTGESASAEAVRAQLGTSDLLHYAGHGDYSGQGGWESSLLLADGTRLTLGDLLALEHVPSWVVLSGCETGRVAGDAPVAGLGLAQAFLLAGSRSVIAATRPADDRRVPAFFAELYRRWAEEPDLARAMQGAQLAWREQNPTEWSIFRLFER